MLVVLPSSKALCTHTTSVSPSHTCNTPAHLYTPAGHPYCASACWWCCRSLTFPECHFHIPVIHTRVTPVTPVVAAAGAVVAVVVVAVAAAAAAAAVVVVVAAVVVIAAVKQPANQTAKHIHTHTQPFLFWCTPDQQCVTCTHLRHPCCCRTPVG